MSLQDMLERTRRDFESFRHVVSAEIPVTDTFLAIVQRWFENVEIAYPIPEMPIDDSERCTLGSDIAKELVDAVDSGLAALRGGTDEDDCLERIAPRLDGLWRELTGVYAPILNAAFRERTEHLDDTIRERLIADMITMTAEANDVSTDEVREYIRSNKAARTRLRQMGVDPDVI